ncbi:hypothetical protein SUNI508_11796 [Seiridium unicorne]|uniref:Uncharacterized protein n=1 Tax=Seiridium unicorne TaxID=138068 RepID=A0ABR2UG36_9PEZI
MNPRTDDDQADWQSDSEGQPLSNYITPEGGFVASRNAHYPYSPSADDLPVQLYTVPYEEGLLQPFAFEEVPSFGLQNGNLDVSHPIQPFDNTPRDFEGSMHPMGQHIHTSTPL